jgi:hypothetical protein
MALYDEIAHKVDPIPLGVTTNMDDDGNFDYICGVEVSEIRGSFARVDEK